MKILALETSFNACSIALQNDRQVISSHHIAPMQQARMILPLIQEILSAGALTINDLDAVAYGCGPGSFTGVRIANSVAQGLGFAGQKPVIPVSSLAALAQTALLAQQCTKVLVAVDARMEQLYWARYQVGEQGLMILDGKEQLCAPMDISRPDTNDWVGAGDGWDKHEKVICTRLGWAPQAVYAALAPTAEAVLQLAAVSLEQGRWIKASEALPVYLR
ncbi:tRNA threonylcarbamoyladenosine biosynthesis protein TsaB [Aquicella siphonis]|uniref:tRNA threonylcarbamoyladenosine biosynthesis protein TsaB n=1 Tax=Aquicella siphonis TaxID=254247 RepID=A0A5E4PHE2_9COXI|nr:tRNA (adenosine(37)-N6)-threonylcarbamoyltransferase complex dimerization subunit type 1 TsaB [Aquicella siphonis]VVC75867.1 tRNA threonylcarbamoyladenosine biosynthesis protein TsaB [Aquicella siphonis]